MTAWRKILGLFILGFVSGVFIESQFNFGLVFAGFLLLIFILILAFWYVSKEKMGLLICVILFSASVGTLWTSFRFDRSEIETSWGNPALLEGVVVDEPDIREANTRLVVETKEFGRILIFTDRYPEYRYGDAVQLKGKLEEPQNQDSFSRDEFFDWRAYLAKEGIHYEMFRPSIKVLETGQESFIIRNLLKFKETFLENLAKVIPEPESSLAGGLIVGAKNSLGADLMEAFRRTGVTHIVVLSGYNLTIVADFLIFIFLAFLPRRYAFLAGVIGIILFTLMTGAGAASVRAAIMASVALLAKHSGRPYNAGLALVVAGFIMIVWNPKVLVFDVGFQLSFLATLGLIYISPLFDGKLLWLKPKFFRELAVTTISAQIAVLPWLLYKIGNLSVVALPVNLIILGVIPVAMLFGFLAGTFGFIATLISLPFGWISYLLLWFIISVVEVFAKLPFASMHISNVPLILVLGVYIASAIFLLRRFREVSFPQVGQLQKPII